MGKYQPKGSLVGVCGVKKNRAHLATKQQQPPRRTKPSPEEKKHVPGKVKNLTRRRGSIREETCWLACKEEDLKEGSRHCCLTFSELLGSAPSRHLLTEVPSQTEVPKRQGAAQTL